MCNVRIHHECEGGIETSIPKITNWHHKAYRVMTNNDHEDWIFPFLCYMKNRLFSCLPLSTAFVLETNVKRLPENHELAESEMVMSF